LTDGTTTVCSVSIVSDTSCWVQPTNVSRSGVTDTRVAAQLTEIGTRLYEHLRSAPTFLFAMVGVEVDDVRTDLEIEAMIRDSHRAYEGLVVSIDLWQRAGRPSEFQPFRSGHVWRQYIGETIRG
jgi:hypothetical protein